MSRRDRSCQEANTITADKSPRTPNNLPLQLTSFVGRHQEISELDDLLASARLVTLTGAGGSGKTRLALQVAGRVLNRYTAGTWFVDLGTRTGSAQPLTMLASVLNVREEPGAQILDQVIERLQEKSLVILDNCEHLAAACAELADTLLRADPRLTILATSRRPLYIDGEITWRVPPLSVPDLKQLPDHEQLSGFEAVQLFVDRARARRTDFAITPDNARAVAELCVHLDGMPLAIELAAARVRVLSVEQIVGRLNERFQLLTSNNQAAPPRQRSLQALIDWSYELLTPDEQTFLQFLSIFSGPFTIEAAQSVSEFDDVAAVELMATLVDRSLVSVQWPPSGSQGTGQARYSLFETIRSYLLVHVDAAGKRERLANKHLAYYLDLATRAELALHGEAQADAIKLIEGNYENILAAQEWALGTGRNIEAALNIVASLTWFWVPRGEFTQARTLIEKTLAYTTGEGKITPARVQALLAASRVALMQGDTGAARAFYEASLAAAREIEDHRATITALTGLGHLEIREGHYNRARQLFTESLDNAREQGEHDLLALATFNHGHLAFYTGELERAEVLLSKALELFNQQGNRSYAAYTSYDLGRIALRQSKYAEAAQLLSESLDMLVKSGSKPGAAEAIYGLAEAALETGNYKRAAELYGASQAIMDRIGSSLNAAERERYERNRDAAQASIGRQQWESAWEHAHTLSFEEAVELARGRQTTPPAEAETPEIHPPVAVPGAPYPGGLTKREVQVLRLVALGLTDAQVGTQLQISTRTVEAHLRKIYRKLQVTTRRAASHFARNHHLV